MSKNALDKKYASDHTKGITSPPTLHLQIAANTQRLFNAEEGYPRRFWMKGTGNFVLRDAGGTVATYNVLSGQAVIFENALEILSTTDVAVICQW